MRLSFVIKIISPPFPPLPPSGPPYSINFSCRKLTQPSPPFPEEIDGVISLHIGFGGKFAKAKNPDQGWINWRNYKKSLINWAQLGDVIFFTHDKDWADTRSTLNFFTDFENLEFFDLSDTDCKGKVRLAGYHGIALTKCFANKDIRSKEVINYLNKIY